MSATSSAGTVTEPQYYGTGTASALATEAAQELTMFTNRHLGVINGNRPNPASFPARHYSYWVFCPRVDCQHQGHTTRRAWVHVGPSEFTRGGRRECDEFERSKHAVHLKEFGDFSSWFRDDNYSYSMSHLAEYDPQFPFAQFTELVKQPGGINLFPVSQIRQYRWHVNQPTAPLIQKWRPDACVGENYYCTYGCTGRSFPEYDHLMNHISVMHADKAEVVALAAELKRPLEVLASLQANNGQTEVNQKLTELIAIFAQNQMQTASPTPMGRARRQPLPPLDDLVDDLVGGGGP